MAMGYESSVGSRAYGGRSSESTDKSEGMLTRRIEEQTAKLPSDFWLMAAGGSIIASLALRSIGASNQSLFVGQWAPTFLLIGIYNKLVKQHGSD